jgi:predicted DNA-binding WGR domain protein
MATHKEQACIYCGKVVTDRPGYPSPNYRRHLRVCWGRMRTFEYHDHTSAKFWSIELRGTNLVVRFGKIGTDGQSQMKKYDDAAKARMGYDKLVAEKVKKGYVEVGGAGALAALLAPTGTARSAKAPKAATSKKGTRAAGHDA